jgi:hypothetical protein
MSRLSPLILTLTLLATAPAGAQTLSLFETTQGQEQGSQATAPISGPGPFEPGPGFSLRSVARFGDSYWGLVTDAVGNSMEVQWQPGEQTSLGELAIYSGYRVLELTPKTLRLQFPQGQPCSTTSQEGFICLDESTVLLSLVSLAPLQRTDSQPLPQDPQLDPGSRGITTDELSNAAGLDNPFAAAVMAAQGQDVEQTAREARSRARVERLQQFHIERIPEDQVPPGMRLVRTPFGDRLVPIRE